MNTTHFLHRALPCLAAMLLLGPVQVRAQEEDGKKAFFLPKSPVAAAYMLGRLSNKELSEAPRSELVYVALLQRKGLEKKYRLEALGGLAKTRNSEPLTELLAGLAELDLKGDEAEPVLRDLAPILLQSKASELSPKKTALESLRTTSQLALTRQIASAALVTADASADPSWGKASSDPLQFADLLMGLPLIPDEKLRAGLYARVEPLLHKTDAPEILRAAITAVAALPGHETDTFKTLAAMAREGTERPTAIASLQKLPRKTWPKDLADPLTGALIGHLEKVPTSERTGNDFINAVQFVSELASLLPPDRARVINKTLRGIGTRVIVIHTIIEQMLYDKNLFVVEAGKPVQIIFENADAMQHNLLVLAPGSAEEVGSASEKMPPEPDAQGRMYVPDSPKVLQATKMLNSGESARLSFDAPEEPGDYPYLCSFPGHWRRMLGNMKVVKDLDAYESTAPEPVQPTMTEWKLEDLAPELNKVGLGRNLEGGRELFTKLGCVQCHKAGAEGNLYGPDLTDVLSRWKGDRSAVLREILEPSKVIADRYRNYQFDLRDGDQVSGMILKEEADSVTIQSGASDALIKTYKKSEIKARQTQGSSVMPIGLLTTASKDQIFDLLAFLEAGGNTHPPAHQHPTP